MLPKGLRTHTLFNYAGYILSYINIVYKPRNIPVQVKDGCRLLIKIIVFIEHFNVKEILVHGLYNSWNTFSLLCRSSTVHCAMMQLTRAVGCPTPTNTHQSSMMSFILYALLQNRCLSCQQNQPFEEDFSYHLGWLSVIVRALLPSKAPFSNPPKLCGTLC